MPASHWRTIIGLVLSAFGVLAGLSTFVFFIYGNYHAAMWALISGVFAAVDFHLLFLHCRGTLINWHTCKTVNDLQILAVFGLVAGLASTAWYIFMFLYYNLPIMPIPDSYQIAAIWSFMTAKWGLGLLITVRHLANELYIHYPDLLPDPYVRSPNYYSRIRGRP